MCTNLYRSSVARKGKAVLFVHVLHRQSPRFQKTLHNSEKISETITIFFISSFHAMKIGNSKIHCDEIKWQTCARSFTWANVTRKTTHSSMPTTKYPRRCNGLCHSLSALNMSESASRSFSRSLPPVPFLFAFSVVALTRYLKSFGWIDFAKNP